MAGMRRQSRGRRRRCVEVKETLPVMDRFWNLTLYLRNHSNAGDLWCHGFCGSGVSALFGWVFCKAAAEALTWLRPAAKHYRGRPRFQIYAIGRTPLAVGVSRTPAFSCVSLEGHSSSSRLPCLFSNMTASFIKDGSEVAESSLHGRMNATFFGTWSMQLWASSGSAFWYFYLKKWLQWAVSYWGPQARKNQTRGEEERVCNPHEYCMLQNLHKLSRNLGGGCRNS